MWLLRLRCACLSGSKQVSCLLYLSHWANTLCIQSCTILDSDTFAETRGRLRSADGQCKPPSSDRLDTLALYYIQLTLTQYTQNIDGNLLLKDSPRGYMHPFLYISCDTYCCQCMLSYLLVAIPPCCHEVCHSHSASITLCTQLLVGACVTLCLSVCLVCLVKAGMHCLHSHTTCKLWKVNCAGISYPKSGQVLSSDGTSVMGIAHTQLLLVQVIIILIDVYVIHANIM